MDFSEYEIAKFRRSLLRWFVLHKRDLPWRRTRDPYAIWLSETMLQQTRVAAAIPYYGRFLARFPDFKCLAEAAERDLLSMWAGLGYYYRARNMQKAAQLMLEAGTFPNAYQELRTLPGIGDYTAAAVASIAFGLPHAAVDGNVLRVLSRVMTDGADIASSSGRKRFAELAGNLLDRNRPGDFNQAMMELGATVCLPKNPQCLVCPVSSICRARQTGAQTQFPVKLSKQKSVEESRTVYWIERDARVLAWQRPRNSSLMAGFWELPEGEQLGSVSVAESMGNFRHGITSHNYSFEVVAAAPPLSLDRCVWLETNQLESFPISTIFKKARLVVEKYRMRQTGTSRAASGR
ncbi:MAG: A/G-specific adenine glycosylase [Acidobacteriota bacterium]|nr:A/G-specific adenine glycosylase [Acidobacteriota bacterium]